MPDPGSDKQEAILKTALTLFTERGFFGTPTSLISKEAGVATGTLFFYFKTKEALIDTLYLRVKAEAAAAMCRGLDEEPDTASRLRRLWRNVVMWGVKNPKKMQFMEQFAHSPFVSTSAHEEGMSRFGFMADLVRDGVREGIIRDFDPPLLFCMMASSLASVITCVAAAGNADDRERLIEQGMDFVWSGLAAKDGPDQHGRKKKEKK
jgi:AcrR family transcriptional regulator